MAYGLIAAVAWGTSAVAATMAARRVGIYVAVLSAQGPGLVMLLLLAAFIRPSLAGIHGSVAAGLVGAGLVGLVGYLAFYRAVAHGPVGLVSAISATYGGVTALLAVVILGEALGGYGTAGAVLAVGGVALATARSRAAAEKPVAVSEPIVGIAPVPRAGASDLARQHPARVRLSTCLRDRRHRHRPRPAWPNRMSTNRMIARGRTRRQYVRDSRRTAEES
jgi:uncharacterized membrane protein